MTVICLSAPVKKVILKYEKSTSEPICYPQTDYSAIFTYTLRFSLKIPNGYQYTKHCYRGVGGCRQGGLE